jgi:hypothetical protein
MEQKEEKILIQRLERIFPKMEMNFDAEPFNIDKHGCYQDCTPTHSINWYQFLEKLKQNGLEIKKINIK